MEPSNLTSEIGTNSTTQCGPSLMGTLANVGQAPNIGTYNVSCGGTIDPNGNVFHKTTRGIQVHGSYNIIIGINGIMRPMLINGNYKLYFPVVDISGGISTSSFDLTPDQYRFMRETLLNPRPVLISSENATAHNSPASVSQFSGYGAVNQASRNYDRVNDSFRNVWMGAVDQFTPIEEIENTNNNEEVDDTNNNEEEDLYF